jgi:hypothetical protein
MRITKKQDQRIRKQVQRIATINQNYPKEQQIKREIKLEVKTPRGKPTTSKEQIETILTEYEQTT